MEKDVLKDMLEVAIADLEAAYGIWTTRGTMTGDDFRLRVAQTEALISVAQSLAVLAECAFKVSAANEIERLSPPRPI